MKILQNFTEISQLNIFILIPSFAFLSPQTHLPPFSPSFTPNQQSNWQATRAQADKTSESLNLTKKLPKTKFKQKPVKLISHQTSLPNKFQTDSFKRRNNHQKKPLLNQYNYLIRESMSSFLFQREQINCACFQSSPQNVRRIFRSESQHSGGLGSKSFNQTPVIFQTPKTKLKKKSLKKQKPYDPSVSPDIPTNSEQKLPQTLFPQIQFKNTKKQSPFANFQQFQTIRPQKIQTQRSKPTLNTKSPLIQPLFPSQEFLIPQISKSHNYSQSHHIIAPNYNEQYDKLVQQEFKKDLNDFRLKMNLKETNKNNQYPCPEDNRALKRQQKCLYQLPVPSIRVFQTQFLQQNLFTKGQLELKQPAPTQKLHTNKKHTAIKQHLPSKKNSIDRYDSLQLIPQQRILQKSLYDLTEAPAPRQRKQSFTNSTILYKEKELQNRKIKHKMYAKEIESQKDGSSENQSDKMSQVVGRGWDGLTEQKIELDELDDLMKRKESIHSQTMITQESHIKNSEIKTFTDFSNQFISPKSQKTRVMQTSTAFGGGKYGLASISYQYIDDLQRLKNSAYGKLHF